MKTLREFALSPELILVAHRGSSGTSPENTLIAFEEALHAGADMVECDAQFTMDGEIVLYHDLVPLNFPAPIAELTYSDLLNLDLSTGYNDRPVNQRIPKLSDLIGLIKGRAYLLIELKSSDESIERLKKLAEFVVASGYDKYTLFASFFWENIINLKKLNSRLLTAAIRRSHENYTPNDTARMTGCDAYILSLDELNIEIAEDAKSNSIIYGVYGVDTESELERAVGLGVKAIGTNYPAKMNNDMKARNLR